MDLRGKPVHQMVEAVSSKEVSAYQLIEKTLENCALVNEALNIFSVIAGVDALEQARAIDKRLEVGENLPLAGIPVAVKDDIFYGVLPTGLGSAAFKEFIPPYTATAVERLMDAGAIVIGKTNIGDMGLGSSTVSSPNGPTVNPWDAGYAAGSAGAAAVITGLCMLALESDTGGALRQGASHCGVAGLRPGMGRVSRYGLNADSSSFAQVGVTALSGDDILCALEVISGPDGRDASLAAEDKWAAGGRVAPDLQSESLTIGYPAAAFDLPEPEIREVYEKARERYQAGGYRLTEIDLGLLPEALRAYYVICLAETSSNHARFDGIRFGRAAEAGDLEELYAKSRRLTLGPEARRCSIFGTYILGKGHYDRYYRQALKIWNLVRREFNRVLKECDLLMLPVVKAAPVRLDEEANFLENWGADLFTAPVSMAGLPAISLPAGQVGKMPVGLQLVGRPFSEKLLTAVCDRLAPENKLFPHRGPS